MSRERLAQPRKVRLGEHGASAWNARETRPIDQYILAQHDHSARGRARTIPRDGRQVGRALLGQRQLRLDLLTTPVVQYDASFSQMPSSEGQGTYLLTSLLSFGRHVRCVGLECGSVCGRACT